MSRNLLLFSFLFFQYYIALSQQTDSYPPVFEKGLKNYQVLKSQDLDSAFLLINRLLDQYTTGDENKLFKKLLADTELQKNRLDKADSIYREVLPWFLNSEYFKMTLSIFENQGRIFQMKGLLVDGLTHMDIALSFIEKHEQKLQRNDLQIAIGSIYRVTGILFAIQAETDETFNQTASKKYFKKAHTVFSTIGEPELEGLALMNLGNVMDSEDSTIFYWEKALGIFEKNQLTNRTLQIYQNLGILYLDQGSYNQSLTYHDKLKSSMLTSSDPYDKALFLVKYGKVHLGINKMDLGLAYLQNALEVAKLHGLSTIEEEALTALIQGFYKTKSFEKAVETYIAYDSLSKALNLQEAERIFRDTEARYKTKEQQDQIQLLKQEEALNEAKLRQQQLIIVVVIITAVLIAFLSYFLWRQAKVKSEINTQLKNLDETRKRFLINVSHELRTPITLINAPLQDAIEQLEKGDLSRVSNDLQKISNNSRKLLQLTEEVLDISKLDDNAMKMDIKPTDLKAFVTRTFMAFESLAFRKKIDWTIDNQITDGVYNIDQKKLEKVINNLLSNALKYTSEGGKVNVIASTNAKELQFSVIDSGRGISQEALPHIFTRYYQAQQEDRDIGGLGIGLAFIKELIEFMNGHISVESVLELGTTFKVRIPISIPELSNVDQSISDPKPNIENRPDLDLSDSTKPHILVVEDNVEMADFIKTVLADSYRVTLAVNGKEGIKRLQVSSFDLITADVMMPEMNGHEFIMHLKEHSDWKNLPTILVTALADETDKVAGLQLGIDDYISKPFNTRELKARVSNLLNNARVRKETNLTSEDTLIDNEQELLIKAKSTIEDRIGDKALNVSHLAESLNLSERQANRVLKKITGLTCLQFIREIKLQKAHRLLETRKYRTIAEVVYAVGFENTSYFSRLFIERFGKKPSDLLQ